jgi:hypothetical protein
MLKELNQQAKGLVDLFFSVCNLLSYKILAKELGCILVALETLRTNRLP